MKHISLLLLALPLIHAYWRIPCQSRLVDERIDPIVSPGKISSHVHTVSGANGFGFTTTYEDLRGSTMSSCPIRQDLSAYWTPLLYFQTKDGKFLSVPRLGDNSNGGLGGMTVYYLQRPGHSGEQLKAFPEGFRMIAGNPFNRNYTDTFANQAISFMCLDYENGSIQTNYLPRRNCPQGVRAQVFFPQCSDGRLDSHDHTSHVSYPDPNKGGVYNGGSCPDSHPHHMIGLFFEVVYQTNLFADEFHDVANSGQPFVFANGDPTGYGFHGDFMNGWNTTALQNAIDNCTNDSGRMQDCPVFDYFNDSESRDCHIPDTIVETVSTKAGEPLDALPGCNAVTSGPEEAEIASCPDQEPPKVLSKAELDASMFTSVLDSIHWSFQGCGIDSVSSRTLNGSFKSDNNMTVENCVDFCNQAGYEIAGAEFATQCYCGHANQLPSNMLVPDSCNMKCRGNSTQICGGPNALSLYRKCDSKSNKLLSIGSLLNSTRSFLNNTESSLLKPGTAAAEKSESHNSSGGKCSDAAMPSLIGSWIPTVSP